MQHIISLMGSLCVERELTLIEVLGHYFSSGKLENWVKCFMEHFVLLRWLPH